MDANPAEANLSVNEEIGGGYANCSASGNRLQGHEFGSLGGGEHKVNTAQGLRVLADKQSPKPCSGLAHAQQQPRKLIQLGNIESPGASLRKGAKFGGARRGRRGFWCGDAKGEKGEQTQLCESLRSGARGDAAVPKLCLARKLRGWEQNVAGGMRYEVRGTSAFSGRPIAARFVAPEAGNRQFRGEGLRLVACRKSVPAVVVGQRTEYTRRSHI
ncbi:hypothetical protein V8C44DRAFT_273688 [Trichoderma aethiopicum]